MPVLPDVASTTVWPGFRVLVAPGIFDDAEREAILDGGERVERFALDVDRSPEGAIRLMRTTRVLPMVSRMLS